MPETQVPVKETPIGVANYIASFVRVWKSVRDEIETLSQGKMTRAQFGPDVAPKTAAAISFAQYMIETGDKHIFNFNVGNVKHTTGDGFDFHVLSGVWEGVSPEEADRLIASGKATADPSTDHAAAVGPGKVSVILTGAGRSFRAFKSLDDGMREQVKILAKRFSRAWPPLLAGDVDGFAQALKSMGYFTASAGAYANGMRPSFNRAMQSDSYSLALTTLQAFSTSPQMPFLSSMGSIGRVAAGTAATGGILYGIWKWWSTR